MLGTTAVLLFLEATVRLTLPQDHLLRGEFITRVVSPAGLKSPYVPDPLLGYRLFPGVEYETRTTEFSVRITANGYGFRESPPKNESTGDKPIVVSTGDSFFFGHGVEEKDRALDILAALHPELDWMNLSLPGTGTDQHLFFWRHHGKPSRPSLVIEWVFPNDLADNLLDHHYFPKPGFRMGPDGKLLEYPAAGSKREKPALFNVTDRILTSHSHLYALLRNRVKLLQMTRNPEANRNNSLLFAYSPVKQTSYVRDAITLLKAVLSQYAREVRESGAGFAVVVIPHLWELEMPGSSFWNDWRKLAGELGMDSSDFDLDAFRHEIIRWGETENVPVFSLQPYFRQAVAEGIRPYYPVDGHWTVEGNRTAAEAFATDFMPHLQPMIAAAP